MNVKRVSQKEIQKQAQDISDIDYLEPILNTFSDFIVIVNKQRQVVFANEMFVKFLGKKNMEAALGQRPGELIQCIHANSGDDGCGTGKDCLYCGAVLTVLESQISNKQVENEARITTEVNNELISLDLKVTAKPLRIKNEEYTLAILRDISTLKRKERLERAFIHDITNSIYYLTNKIDLFPIEKCSEIPRENFKLIKNQAIKVSDEIEAQKDIIRIETGELEPHFVTVTTKGIIKSALNTLSPTKKDAKLQVKIDEKTVNKKIKTDPRLLQRVLINLLKNALEANNGEIFVGCREKDQMVEFWVKNNTVMSKEVKSQVFQRSYSTKGVGRGIGTYSVKLITEQYLNGKVDFKSKKEIGTIFNVMIPISPN